ncbi:hypothetical protein UlMin_043937 [Ulmus minor]
MKRVREEEETVYKKERSVCNNGGEWIRGPLLGQGGFGTVYSAVMKKPGMGFRDNFPAIMAVKCAKGEAFADLVDEMSVLTELYGCPFIIKCFGGELTRDDQGEDVFHMFLEYATGGSLANLIVKSNGLGLLESQVRRYTYHVLEGIRGIHDKGFIHCDLKPENILLVRKNDSEFLAKIADFGCAKTMDESDISTEVSGTTMYFSPEIVIEGVQEQPSDIWALGCIVLSMLTGKEPWKHRRPERKIAKESPIIPDECSEEAKDFLKKCFSKNPKERPTAEMLLSHPFVKDERKRKLTIIFQGRRLG